MGLDIRDLFRDNGKLSPRYVLILAGHLPETSAFFAARRGGPQFRPWTSTTHLLALIANLTYAANRQRGGKQTRNAIVKPPKRNEKPRKVTVSELLRLPRGS